MNIFNNSLIPHVHILVSKISLMIGEGEERVTLLQQKENNNNEFCNVIKNKIRQINLSWCPSSLKNLQLNPRKPSK